MGGIWTAQTNFTKGELDPLLLGRIDLAAFYQGAQTAKNMLSIPQGGTRKRPGTLFIDEALGDARLENFSFNIEQNYLLVFTEGEFRVYKDDVLQTTVVTPYTAIADIREFDYIQAIDSVVITHPDYEPRLIQRTSDVAWTITTVPLTNIPQFDYNDASSPVPVDEVQTITFANVTNGDRFKISLEGILTEDVAYSTSSAATTAANMQQALLDLPNTPNSGISCVFIGAATFQITFTDVAAKNWDEMTVTPIQVGNPAFSGTTATIQNGVSRAEDVWSATRGWPVTCTFHESRLWFGGSKSRPATMWGSNVGDVFNFDVGRSRDDEAIDVTLATNQVNAITSLISNRSLQVFTSGAEFYIPTSPITPSGISVRPQTSLGSKRVQPVVLEGLTYYLQRTGKALYQFQFVDEFQSNESQSVSILAPHLIKDPIQLYVSRGTSETDANYIYILNADGTLTVFNVQTFEGVRALTSWESYGDINSIAVVDEQLYLLVERNGTYYIDKSDTTLNTDSAVYQTSINSDVITGLTHLEGETVVVKADGAKLLDRVVSGGQITVEREVIDAEVGIQYTPEVQTMPLNIGLQNGPNAAQKKRILRCAIRVDESNGVIVNGQRLADKTIGQDQFDPPVPQSEFKRVFLHGWSLDATVTITQDTPFPLTVLALDLEVKT